MNQKEIKALISLLDDHDHDVSSHVEQKIISLGEGVIPFLEEEWEENLNPEMQKRIEDLIHNLQYESLAEKLVRWKEAGATDLLEGMWLINSYQYPDVSQAHLVKTIEQIYYEAWVGMRPDMHPYDQVKALNHVLFKTYRFSANTKNFHSPANSMLHLVLESKKGNPLTLCVIYMIIARKLEMPVYGVNLPNLFIMTYKVDDLQFYINAYNRGLILSKGDIDNYLLQLNLNPLDLFYEPCSNLDIVQRALRNLVMSFEKLDELEKAAEVAKLLDSITDSNSTGTEPLNNKEEE